MKKTDEIFELLKKSYPDAKVALMFDSPFQLLVAVILSAQCTDERVNMVTPVLFGRFATAAAMAEADIEEIKKIIFSTGFYNNKAKNILAASKMIMRDFDGELPKTMDEMLRLPGVARKTANVVLTEAFGVVEGIVVDTHVIRVSGKLGLVSAKLAKSKSAVPIENILMKKFSKNQWNKISMLMIFHGRRTCIARRPKCATCSLKDICPSSEL